MNFEKLVDQAQVEFVRSHEDRNMFNLKFFGGCIPFWRKGGMQLDGKIGKFKVTARMYQPGKFSIEVEPAE